MSSNIRRLKILGAVLLVFFVFIGLLFWSGYFGNSATRIEREHGLKLPSSAHNFVCRGDAWMHHFVDSGASSAFEMSARDIPAFVSQLNVHKLEQSECCIFPSNFQYPIHRSWMLGPAKTYHCASSTGSSLDIQIWPLDGSRVGVLLYTNWN